MKKICFAAALLLLMFCFSVLPASAKEYQENGYEYSLYGKEAVSLCQVFVGTFFVFSNSVEKLCVSWALSLVECVAVWALKLPVPHTDVLKPTSRKVFLRNY